jgi:hypothetical protein
MLIRRTGPGNDCERREVARSIASQRSFAAHRTDPQDGGNANTREARHGIGGIGKGAAISLKNRIRRIEEKLGAAVKANGEELPWPDITTTFVGTLLDAEGNHIYGGRRLEYMRARVSFGEQTTYYDRREGESYDECISRAFASTPRGRFARRFTPVSCETETDRAPVRY